MTVAMIRAAWTLRYGWERRYQREKAAQRFWSWLSDRMPRPLRYATFIRVAADATMAPELSHAEVPAIPLDTLLRHVHEQIGG